MLRKKVKFKVLIYKYHFQVSYQYSNRFRVTSMKYPGECATDYTTGDK
jgi:hypothetical protein